MTTYLSVQIDFHQFQLIRIVMSLSVSCLYLIVLSLLVLYYHVLLLLGSIANIYMYMYILYM